MRTYHELNLPARTEYSGRGGGRRCMWRAGPPGGLHLQRNPTVRTVAQLRGWFQRETIRRPASGAARHTRFAFSTHRARKQMNSTRNTTVPTVSASTLEHETTQRAGYCMDGSEIGPVQRSTGGRSLGRTERRRGRAGGCAAAYVMLVGSGQVWRLITVVITS
jgi:hypothetical protein